MIYAAHVHYIISCVQIYSYSGNTNKNNNIKFRIYFRINNGLRLLPKEVRF